MARFITTAEINFIIEDIFTKSKGEVLIASPFLKVNHRLKDIFTDQVKQGVKFDIIYGKKKQENSLSELKKIQGFEIFYCESLHAKLYMNEEKCVVTSLNLYDYSQVNNDESGVLLTKKDDPEAFEAARKEFERLKRVSKLEKGRKSAFTSKSIAAPGVITKASAGKAGLNKEQRFLTASKIAESIGIKTNEFLDKLVDKGCFNKKGSSYFVTDLGKKFGIMARKGNGYWYFLFPADFSLPEEKISPDNASIEQEKGEENKKESSSGKTEEKKIEGWEWVKTLFNK